MRCCECDGHYQAIFDFSDGVWWVMGCRFCVEIVIVEGYDCCIGHPVDVVKRRDGFIKLQWDNQTRRLNRDQSTILANWITKAASGAMVGEE